MDKVILPDLDTLTGITPLMLACYKGTDELVTKILGHMTDVNAKDKKGRSCLHYFVLPRNPFHFHADEFEDTCDILHTATFATESRFLPPKSPETIKKLVEAGADVSCKDQFGRNALHYALIYNKDLENIKELVNCGVNVKDKDNSGHDAIYYSENKGNRKKDIIEYLKSL